MTSRKAAKPLSFDVIARKCSQEIEQKYYLPRRASLTFFSHFSFFSLRVRPGSGGLVVGGHAKARPYSEDSKLILVPVVKSVVPVV